MSAPKVLIPFYSRTGTIERLARAVAEGVEGEGGEVRLRRARELVGPDIMSTVPGWNESAQAMNARYPIPTAEDAEWADAVIFGTPTRFGIVSSELKAYIDSLGGLWFAGKLNGKVGSVFAGSAQPHGGNEATVLSLWAPLAHLGFHHCAHRLCRWRDVCRRWFALWRLGYIWQFAVGTNRSRTCSRSLPGKARGPSGKKAPGFLSLPYGQTLSRGLLSGSALSEPNPRTGCRSDQEFCRAV